MTSIANPSDALPSVHIFNPANDEALGSNNRWYTPSRHALQYQHDCELLPIWWAKDGDYIIAPHHSDSEITEAAQKAHVNVRRYQPGLAASPAPWGWSQDAKRQFEEAGLPPIYLPSDHAIADIRLSSHRRLAITVNNALTKRTGIDAPNHQRIYASAEDMTARGGDNCMLKRPWSSSGRGVFPTSTLTDAELLRLAGGIIRRQGSVIVEDALPKVMDMSALFYADTNGIRHHAWSVFQTTTDGRYMGSMVMPQTDVLSFLHDADIRYGDNPADFSHISHMLADILADVLQRYRGWIGVDMLAYGDICNNEALHLAPCIEINLRMTMGVVATMLASNKVIPDMPYLLRTVPPDTTLSDGSIRLAGTSSGFSVILQPAMQ